VPAVKTFIRQVTAGTTYHPDGTTTTEKRPAVWTLAHRGYSGGGRLDVWAYPTKATALRAGAELAMEAGMDEGDEAVALFDAGRYAQLLQRYEQTQLADHLLRVQPAWLQHEEH